MGERNGGELTVDLDEDTRRSVAAAAPQLAGVCMSTQTSRLWRWSQSGPSPSELSTSKAPSKVLVMKRSTGSDAHAR